MKVKEPRDHGVDKKTSQEPRTANLQIADKGDIRKSTEELIESPDHQELLKRGKDWFHRRTDSADVLRNAVKQLYEIYLIDYMDNLELGCNVRDCDRADSAYGCFVMLSDLLNRDEVDQIVAEVKEKVGWSDSWTGEPFSGRGCHSKS